MLVQGDPGERGIEVFPPGPVTFNSIYGGEDFDARLVQKNWNRARFNDSTWATAVTLAGPGGELRGLSCAAPPLDFFETLEATLRLFGLGGLSPETLHELHFPHDLFVLAGRRGLLHFEVLLPRNDIRFIVAAVLNGLAGLDGQHFARRDPHAAFAEGLYSRNDEREFAFKPFPADKLEKRNGRAMLAAKCDSGEYPRVAIARLGLLSHPRNP